jgi:hypothetical protein
MVQDIPKGITVSGRENLGLEERRMCAGSNGIKGILVSIRPLKIVPLAAITMTMLQVLHEDEAMVVSGRRTDELR